MAVVGSIDVEIIAKFEKFVRGMNKAADTVDRNAKAMSKDLKALGKVVRRFSAFAIGTAGIGGFIAKISMAAKELEDLSLASAKLGIAERSLGGLQFAASKTGISIQQLNTGIQRMARRVSEARKGTGEAVKAIKELGLSATNLGRMGTEKAFLRIGNSINKIADAGERVRLLMRFFDTEGVGLGNLFAIGPGAIQDAIARSNFAGGEEVSEAAKEIQNAKAEWENAWKGFANTVIVGSNRVRRALVRAGESERLFAESVGGRLRGANRARFGSTLGGATNIDAPARRQAMGIDMAKKASQAFDRAGKEYQSRARMGVKMVDGMHRGFAKLGDTIDIATEALSRLQGKLFMSGARGAVSTYLTLPLERGFKGYRDMVGRAQATLPGISRRMLLAQQLGRPGARRQRQNIEFNRLLDQVQGRGGGGGRINVNPFIESTSAEGFAAIKRSQKAASEPIVRINTAILEELKRLGTILGRGEELVGVSP